MFAWLRRVISEGLKVDAWTVSLNVSSIMPLVRLSRALITLGPISSSAKLSANLGLRGSRALPDMSMTVPWPALMYDVVGVSNRGLFRRKTSTSSLLK